MTVSSARPVLVTGSEGFLGRNLGVALRRRGDVRLLTFDVANGAEDLARLAPEADVIYHLAGVNRPQRQEDFAEGNTALTARLLDVLRGCGRSPRIVLPSSTQAELDNPYGKSKKAAEDALEAFAGESGADVRIYRLPGVFGKWSRPNYNTVVATFCHNIARGLDIIVSDPPREIELVYVDDLVEEFVGLLDAPPSRGVRRSRIRRSFRVTLGELAERIRSYREMRQTLVIPDFSDALTQRLYATYLSFLPEGDFSYPLQVRSDERGDLFEVIKSEGSGQIFVSRTRPGVTRGNHYHDTKVEKFCVLKGKAVIRFRHLLGGAVVEYPVSDTKMEVVDVPPGYTHSIENVGDVEMIVLFWAGQRFDPARPDTHSLEV